MKSVFYLISLLLFILQGHSLANASTTFSAVLDSNDDPIVYTKVLNYKRLVVDYAAGTSTSAAIKTYIPVESAADGVRPDANLLGGDIISAASGALRFDLKIVNTDGSDHYLVGALKVDGVWSVIYKNTINASTTYDPYAAEIAGTKFWSDITALNNAVKDYYLYFFSTDTVYAIDEVIDESALPSGGLYYRTYLSGKLYTSASYDPRVSTPEKGDGRIFLHFRSELIPNAYMAKVISYPSAQGEFNFGDATAIGTVFNHDYTACDGDEQIFTVNELQNATTYHLAVTCVDKFQFATRFSSSVSETPESIEAFLKKNACYLISAGFQREHYVLAYFRNFRDQVLATTSLGQNFISWYYRTAPKYALIIAHSPILSFFMRAGAYFLYFIFSLWKLLLIPMPFIIGLLVFLRYRKRGSHA